MKYLDPKADLTFKKIFGEHPDLVISLLNALLPLSKEQEIKEVQYLSPERVPSTSAGKDSFVDVCCKDKLGRQFIVEMQMYWTSNFKQRVLLNTSKVYVSQIEGGEKFSELQPVYSLNLVNDIFERDLPDFYHYYRLVHEMYTDKILEGFHIVFVELPKFKPHTITERKMMVLWLRFLTEIDTQTTEVPFELLENPEVNKALNLVEQSAYTREEMMGYDRFWDLVRREKALAEASETRFKEGIKEGRKEGIKEGRKEGIKEGIKEGREEVARNLKAMGMSLQEIERATGLSAEEINTL